MIKKTLLAVLLLSSLSAFALHHDRKCLSCHTPHFADTSVTDAPLWDVAPPTTGDAGWNVYDTSTMDAVAGIPGGTSKLCLGCHDTDSHALGLQADGVTGGLLSDDHPISFEYDTALAVADGYLADPALAPSRLGNYQVHTDSGSLLPDGVTTCSGWGGCWTPVDNPNSNQTTINVDLLKHTAGPGGLPAERTLLECTSCHDHHNKFDISYTHGDTTVNYFTMSVQKGYLCKTCHFFSRFGDITPDWINDVDPDVHDDLQ